MTRDEAVASGMELFPIGDLLSMTRETLESLLAASYYMGRQSAFKDYQDGFPALTSAKPTGEQSCFAQ